MTNIDNSIEDTLLWLEALRGHVSSDMPMHTAREAILMQKLVREYHQAHAQIANNSTRLEANWLIIRERLHVAEAARARDVARSGTTPASSATSAFRGHLRKVGSTLSGLHFGVRLLATGILFTALVMAWSQWRTLQPGDDSAVNVGEPYLRGDENTQRIKQTNPSNFADQVDTILRKENITARRVALVDDQGKATGAIHLQAKVPPDSSTIPALQSIGIVTPQSGRLDVVIVPES
ncbi:MAG: hypothetical protein H7232_02540 [Aeromicrobium sp.]|nr:hypothetical protein [Burkholderiales bacterium]